MVDPAYPRYGDVVRIRGERWRIVGCLAYDASAIIDAAGCDTHNRGVLARFLLPCERLDRLELSSTPRVVRPAAWQHVARRSLGEAQPSFMALRAAASAHLSIVPFQLEPALALIRGDGCRILIADEVGLGKTIQAGLIVAEIVHRRPDARVLIVCPAGLREQWCDELHTRFDLAADILDAAGVARSAAALPIGLNPWSTRPLIIASIDYVKRAEVMRCLEPLIWDVVVFGEAHALSGRSDRTAAAAQLANRARALVMLTATPHSGDDEAFGRLCGLGRLKDDGPLLMFRRTRGDAGMAIPRRVVLLRVTPTAAETAMHSALRAYSDAVLSRPSASEAGDARLAMSVLMRRACSSAGSLERSVLRRVELLASCDESSPTQLDLFASGDEDEEPSHLLAVPGLADANEERNHLERIAVLARTAACDESKLAVLRRFIRRTGEPAIVFTEYRDTLQRVAALFSDTDAVLLHGGLTAAQRIETLRRFTSGSARLLLATDAASEGLNLQQRCRLTISLELPWNPVRLEQRTGRVDRIGQTRRVHAVHLIASGTAEESVLSRLITRISRIRAAIPSSVIGLPVDERTAAIDVPIPPGRGLVTANLRIEAAHEAERIQLARSLQHRTGAPRPDSRPVVTAMRRRSAVIDPECFCLFRFVFTDARGCVVAEQVRALSVRLAHQMCSLRPADVRALVAALHPPLAHEAARLRQCTLEELERQLQQPLLTWIRRERAIAEAFRQRHARLSAALVQRGLFDRRNERAAAAQADVLAEVVDRSTARLTELAAWNAIAAEPSELLWALARF